MDVVSKKELIQIYTESNMLIANDLMASCKTENDLSEYYVPLFRTLSKLSNSLP